MSSDKLQKRSPLMRQYHQIKEKYPDTVMLFRLGDFYETFEGDAEIASRVCGITLTKRANGSEGETPLAGFPYHQLDNYLPKFIKAGLRVAICEQLEDPKLARGIVRRDVVEVITPGVAMSDKILESNSNNYLAAIYIEKGKVGIAFCDVSTGEFSTTESNSNLQEILETISPAEILISKSQKNEIKNLKLSLSPLITKLEEWIFDLDYASDRLNEHFGTLSLKGFGIQGMRLAEIAAGAIMHYLLETQKSKLGHIKKLSIYHHGDYIALDSATKRNLEILFSTNGGSKNGSLLNVIDKTSTPMGGRLLKRWLVHPLRSVEQINKRLNAVEDLYNNTNISNDLEKALRSVSDLERLMGKCATNRANPRDLGFIRNTLRVIPIVCKLMESCNSITLTALGKSFIPIPDLIKKLEEALPEEPSINIGEGNGIRIGYNTDLDDIREVIAGGKLFIEKIQTRERIRTNIPSLKIGFNNVFGYYIEITNSNKDKVPSDYIRKQTLTNAERYITPELKEFEEKALNAEDKIEQIERKLFVELVYFTNGYIESLLRNASLIAMIDCFTCLSKVAHQRNYVKPIVNDSDVLEIHNGRHPVVETLLKHSDVFIPNDTNLDLNNNQIAIITGPNMSGKSSLLRQVGLIVLLAQIGSYVPAESAVIGIVDKIFTRVGAQDNIAAGESTFLVEMNEAANILNNSTNRSLILLDEVGRGTSTFDGISIAWSIAEYIHDKIGARTLFATHYHELNELSERFNRIKNFKVEVREHADKIIFLRKVTPGTADHSYGIQVAQMAGLPEEVTERAKIILKQLEGENSESLNDNLVEVQDTFNENTIKNVRKTNGKNISHQPLQFSLFEINSDPKIEKLKIALSNININELTPIQAILELEKLINILK